MSIEYEWREEGAIGDNPLLAIVVETVATSSDNGRFVKSRQRKFFAPQKTVRSLPCVISWTIQILR